MTYENAKELKELAPWAKRKTVVFMSDFGYVDGAVSAMHGVADEVDHTLKLEDLTHEIPQFNIWEASYRLIQTITFWAPGTVFVSVVDPGVGSERESVAVLTKSGHVIVTPDNGTLSHVAKDIGILERRKISETINRLKNSQRSFTFYGRDVYAYTGARIASGTITFDEVGPLLDSKPVMLNVTDPVIEKNEICGNIDILDTRYGSLWTNIPDTMIFEKYGIKYGDSVRVLISHDHKIVFGYTMKMCKNFTEVAIGEPLLYINSLLNVGLAINQGSFAQQYRIGSGENWAIKLQKA
jgi:S-adenosylmethionine hydrolase